MKNEAGPITASTGAQLDVEVWARQIIRDAVQEYGAPLPRYGTAEWATAPAPQRWAAAIVAAECWRSESDPAAIAERLRVELEQLRLTAKQLEDAEYVADAKQWADQWKWLTARPGPTAERPTSGRRGNGTAAGQIVAAWLDGPDHESGAVA